MPVDFLMMHSCDIDPPFDPCIAPRPSAQEALQALQQGQQNIVSSIGGLGSKLASMAQFEAMDNVIGHFSDLFAPTEYQLENYSDLMSYADLYIMKEG